MTTKHTPAPLLDSLGRKKRIEKTAPDLLAALIACDEAMEYISEYDIPLTLSQQVKDAIAKATGELK